MKKFLLLFFSAVFCGLSSFAYDFRAGDLCYKILGESPKTVAVTNAKNYGDGIPSYYKLPANLTIPSEVLHGNETCKVIAITHNAFRSCDDLKAVVISEGIESIGVMSFEACGHIKTIVLPSTLTRIDSYGLENCQGLESIICYAINPPTCGIYALSLNLGAMVDHPTKICNVYVPSESVHRYKQTKPWSDFPIFPIEIGGETGEPQLVDLGLSVRWADRNYHAELPSDYGEFYGWGGAPGLDINSYPSQPNIIATEYDICYKENPGLRLPSFGELAELQDCEWTYAQMNGRIGFNVKGPSGNSIFIPAAGSRNIDGSTYGRRSNAYLWGGDGWGKTAIVLHIDSSAGRIGSIYTTSMTRDLGLSVRAVENTAESGIGQITEDENDIIITAERRAIKIENAPNGELCQICQIDGKMLESSVITGDTHYSISLTSGIYIVKVGSVTRKIMIR